MGSELGFRANPTPTPVEAEPSGGAAEGGGIAQPATPGSWGTAAPLTVRAADGVRVADGGRMPPLGQTARRYQSLSVAPPQVRAARHLSHSSCCAACSLMSELTAVVGRGARGAL